MPMRIVRWAVGAMLFLLLLVVALQNSEPVTLRFHHAWSWQAPLIFIVLAAFVAGVAAGLLAGAVRTTRLARQLTRLRRETRRGDSAPHVDWSSSGAAPGTGPASGPGFERSDRPFGGT